MNLKNTIGDFSIGETVNVESTVYDIFLNDFTGTVKGFRFSEGLVVVEDQDGDCWSCIPDQLSHNTDNIMHAQSHE